MAKTERTLTKTESAATTVASKTTTVASKKAVAPKKKTRTRKLTAEVSKAVQAVLDKKGADVVVLDLRDTPAFTDFFVLCSGNSQRQVKAIADAVEDTLRAAKLRPAHVEGYDRADWVLMDYFSFIVHIFTPQTRSFYALERLWGDAERIDVSDQPAREKAPTA
ncbi:MAG: ribosome silencing factor [Vicinamibacterales bacterium]